MRPYHRLTRSARLGERARPAASTAEDSPSLEAEQAAEPGRHSAKEV
ncbi:MAG: hypothetical protein K6U03_10255 [Firmicutes bacterium]|nr:hypothetical protein [Bacillota bacterium]